MRAIVGDNITYCAIYFIPPCYINCVKWAAWVKMDSVQCIWHGAVSD